MIVFVYDYLCWIMYRLKLVILWLLWFILDLLLDVVHTGFKGKQNKKKIFKKKFRKVVAIKRTATI